MFLGYMETQIVNPSYNLLFFFKAVVTILHYSTQYPTNKKMKNSSEGRTFTTVLFTVTVKKYKGVSLEE